LKEIIKEIIIIIEIIKTKIGYSELGKIL